MFDTNFFAAPLDLVLGALTGLVFGFLLVRGGVSRFETIVGQFRLRDFTVVKVMATAVVVGGLGVYGLEAAGLIENLHVKAAALPANAIGGAIFGIGMAVLGYCPGTGVAALAEGARDARWGIVGMLAGAALYAEIQAPLGRLLRSTFGDAGELGKATLATLTGWSPFAFLVPMGILAAVGFAFLERRERLGRR
ncbi:putative inner membrane protein [Planctomycetes bacterium Pla163]|uniref:Putative inner membrane protein n=1 Tax=Rohdeia mirabilis TaxID=2528008 RepID=A0A518D1E7_9BACT|nr:putative inner membrane protein [Planctomycetes bacterium Pla163]